MSAPPPGGAPKWPRRLLKAEQDTSRRLDEILGPLLSRVEQLRAEVERDDGELQPDAVRREVAMLARELYSTLAQKRAELLDLFPGNPVGILNTSDRAPGDFATWFRPNRVYLDVTDANLDHVDQIWPVVQLDQAELRERGLTTKRAPGRPPLENEVVAEHWRRRVREIGETAAREEFKEQHRPNYPRKEWQTEWARLSQWWRRHVINA